MNGAMQHKQRRRVRVLQRNRDESEYRQVLVYAVHCTELTRRGSLTSCQPESVWQRVKRHESDRIVQEETD